MVKTQQAIDESLEVLAVIPQIKANIADYCAQEIAKADAHDAALAGMSRPAASSMQQAKPVLMRQDLNIRCCGKYLQPLDRKLVESET